MDYHDEETTETSITNPTETDAGNEREPQGYCHLCDKIDLGSLVSPEGYQHARTVEEAKACRKICQLCWHVFRESNMRDWELLSRSKAEGVRVNWAADSRVCIQFSIPSPARGPNKELFFVRRLHAAENSTLVDASALSVVPLTVEPPDNSRKVMIDKAKSWLLQCLEHHQCGAPLPFFDNAGNGLPTRLLDVSTRPDTPSSHIRLVNSNDISSSGQGDDEPLVYFALSHCWGPEGIPGAGKTTLSSLPQRQTAIDIDTLPLNFQHAIRITRDFGADYLWIDALCIIQDSVKDWLEEGARMGAVYSNACLTLAAASSGKAADGFLGHGPVSTPRKHIPLRLDTTGLQEPELGPVDVLLYSHRSLSVFEPKFLDKLKRGTHLLAQRAWCLQENVMSGRVLHFVAGGELVWECREGLRNEFLDFSYGDEIWSAIVPKIASLRPACVQLGHMLTGELDALDLWYNHVVPDFTSRSITFDSDRLAAVGSIARAVAWKCGWTGEDYIAGAWSKDLGRSLAWKMAEFNAYDKHKCGNTTQNTTGSSQAKSTEWRNPSWSWVSARAPVVFEMGHGAFAEILKDDPTQSSGSLVRLVRSELVAGLDPFGPVKSTGIVVEAPICFAGLLMPNAELGFMVMRNGRPAFRRLAMVDVDVAAELPYDDAYPYGDDLTIFMVRVMALYKTRPSVSTAAMWPAWVAGSMNVEAYLLLKPAETSGAEGMECFERIGFMSTPPLFELRMETKTVMLV